LRPKVEVQPSDAGGILRGMADPHSSESSPQRFARGQPASELLRDVNFPLAVRGYDRRAVDDFVEEVRSLVAHLEARQTREGVVQKALDELGEETAGILQRAHETADEIAARSRAQADGRLQRAEREAEIVRREADEYAEQVVSDTRLLWDERQRLLEDIRQLADEVLGTADDAQERLKLPEPLAAAEQDPEPTPPESGRTPIPHPLGLAPAEPDERRLDPSIPYDLESPDDGGEPDAAWSAPPEEDEEGEEDATRAHVRPYAVGSEEDEEPETTAAYAVDPDDDEQDPDATVAWQHVESDEDEPEPESTGPWAVESQDDDEHDPDATVAWAVGSHDEQPDDDDESEADGPGTVELEALPGGNSEEQAAEAEPRRERD
jgi:DivIVA domain-containing protein